MRRKFYLRLTDENGSPLSGLNNVTVLRTGGVVRSTVNISASSPATIRFRHPGMIKDGDILMYGTPSQNRFLSVTADPVYSTSPNQAWEVAVLEISGSSYTINGADRLTLKPDVIGHWQKFYNNESTDIFSVGIASVTTGTGEVQFYCDVPDVDVYATNGVEEKVFSDLPSDARLFVTPEDFGAVGDGVTDDSRAVQIAMDFVSEIKGGGVVWFGSPLGYSISGVSATSVDVQAAGPFVPAGLTGGKPRVLFGTGTPQSVVTAPVGSVYMRTDGGAGTSVYVKESGTGNTGWVGK